MTIGENIRRAMAARGITSISELARQARVERSRLHRVVSGETLSPQIDLVQRVAETLGVSMVELLGRATPRAIAEPIRRQIFVPIVQMPAHAGRERAEWEWEPTGESVEFDESRSRGRRLIAIRVIGDCMEPDARPGGIAIVDMAARQPQNGQMVLVSRDGEMALRWWDVNNRGWVTLGANRVPSVPAQDWTLEGIVIETRNPDPRRSLAARHANDE